MDNKAIRRANLLGLINEFETMARLARHTGVVASLLSQIKNGSRQMGDHVARDLEKALNKPEGWMDLPQYGAGDGVMDQAEALQILQALSEADREAWLRHGRLLVESNVPQGPANPFGKTPRGGRSPGTQ
jgi:transcriptional regulator with XRE-family HTH domain